MEILIEILVLTSNKNLHMKTLIGIISDIIYSILEISNEVLVSENI